MQARDRSNGLSPVLGFSADFKIAFAFEYLAQCLPNKFVVIDN